VQNATFNVSIPPDPLWNQLTLLCSHSYCVHGPRKEEAFGVIHRSYELSMSTVSTNYYILYFGLLSFRGG
jgi:hypothetical protein